MERYIIYALVVYSPQAVAKVKTLLSRHPYSVTATVCFRLHIFVYTYVYCVWHKPRVDLRHVSTRCRWGAFHATSANIIIPGWTARAHGRPILVEQRSQGGEKTASMLTIH